MTTSDDAASMLRWIRDNTLYTLPQIAGMLDDRVTERTLRRWINKQTLPKTSDLNALRTLYTKLQEQTQ